MALPPISRLRHKRIRLLTREFLREFCGTQCRFVVLSSAECNGRHAVGCWIYNEYLRTYCSYNAEVEGLSPCLTTIFNKLRATFRKGFLLCRLFVQNFVRILVVALAK